MVNGVVTLSDTESFRYQIIMKYITGKIYRDEAAILLKLSQRSVTRIVKNGNFGRSSNSKTNPEIKRTILKQKKKNIMFLTVLTFTIF